MHWANLSAAAFWLADTAGGCGGGRHEVLACVHGGSERWRGVLRETDGNLDPGVGLWIGEAGNAVVAHAGCELDPDRVVVGCCRVRRARGAAGSEHERTAAAGERDRQTPRSAKRTIAGGVGASFG